MDVERIVLSAGLFLLRMAIILLVAVGLVRVGRFAYSCGYSIMANEAVDREPGRDVVVNLTSGMSEEQVAKLLEKKGLVENATIFRVQLKVNKYDDKLQPGTYTLNTSMTPKKMMLLLAGEEEK